MSDDEKKAPTSVKGGWPAEANNGLFGAEDRIMALGVKGRFTVVAVLEVDDILHSEADSTRRPVVKFVQLEPVWDAEDREAADDLRETARAIRAGETQLQFPAAEPEESSGDLDIVEPEFEGESPDGSAVVGGEQLAPGVTAQWSDANADDSEDGVRTDDEDES